METNGDIPTKDEERVVKKNAAARQLSSLPDSGTRMSYSSGAIREVDDGKGSPHQIPTIMLRRLSKHFQEGAKKYGRHNWRKGMNLSRYADAAHRHIWDYEDGEESEDHLTAAIWNLSALMWTEKEIKEGRLSEEFDDLSKLKVGAILPNG